MTALPALWADAPTDNQLWPAIPPNREQRRAALRRRAAQRAEERRKHEMEKQDIAAASSSRDGCGGQLDGLDLEAELAPFADDMMAWAEEGLAETAAEWSDL